MDLAYFISCPAVTTEPQKNKYRKTAWAPLCLFVLFTFFAVQRCQTLRLTHTLTTVGVRISSRLRMTQLLTKHLD